MRVQIPAYTTCWMQGDRYGDVVEGSRKLATANQRRSLGMPEAGDVWRVKLDKSARTILCIADDCIVVD